MSCDHCRSQRTSSDRAFPHHFSNAVNEGGVGGIPGEVKPRSLRFTWSMKTTSSRDPNEIMAEIKKVSEQGEG